MSMSCVDILVEDMRTHVESTAIVWEDAEYSYGWLLDSIDCWTERLAGMGIGPGTVCGVVGDYSPELCGLFYALIRAQTVLVPLDRSAGPQIPELASMAHVQRLFSFQGDSWSVETIPDTQANELLSRFQQSEHAGLVLFTSGSTGKPKGILHDCESLLQKFTTRRPGYTSLLVLLMDHIGGFNTIMSVFAYGGTAVISHDRSPETVCRAVQRHRVELLPVTPTFLHLLLASNCHSDFDLSSVKLITYGAEVMGQATLEAVAEVFPLARLQQTYGLSELGILRSKSQESNSLWVKIGGEGFETKVVDGRLHIRAESAMVGYLNAPDPFDADGWFDTGDMVESDGDYLRIRGRESDVINVGGQKVFPVEVETVLMEADNVADVTVYGVPNSLMGNQVEARVSLQEPEDALEMTARLRKFCLSKLARFRVPVRFTLVSQKDQYTLRSKKIRRISPDANLN